MKNWKRLNTTVTVIQNCVKQNKYSLYSFEIGRDVTSGILCISGEVSWNARVENGITAKHARFMVTRSAVEYTIYLKWHHTSNLEAVQTVVTASCLGRQMLNWVLNVNTTKPGFDKFSKYQIQALSESFFLDMVMSEN